jgi:hypothetical protein
MSVLHTATAWKKSQINKIVTFGNSVSVSAVLETLKSVAKQQFLKTVRSPSSHKNQ